MAKILVGYYSRTGNTREMAEAVAEGAGGQKGAKVDCKPIAEVSAGDLLDYDAIVFGSPTYYGTMAAELKKLFDESVEFHGQFDGKVGGAFSSAGAVGGGGETTVVDIVKALLVHGMVVQGGKADYHYGPVAIRKPDEQARKKCLELGRRTAALAVKLHG